MDGFECRERMAAKSEKWLDAHGMADPYGKATRALIDPLKGRISDHALIYADLLLYSVLYLLRYCLAHIFLVRCLGLVYFISIFFFITAWPCVSYFLVFPFVWIGL